MNGRCVAVRTHLMKLLREDLRIRDGTSSETFQIRHGRIEHILWRIREKYFPETRRVHRQASTDISRDGDGHVPRSTVNTDHLVSVAYREFGRRARSSTDVGEKWACNLGQ